MARLYSDLASGSGARYYYALASAPGGVTPATATLTLIGLAPSLFDQVLAFRSPATAVLTINGREPATAVPLIPATAALSVGGMIPGELRQIVVTPAVAPDYTDLPENPPTVLFIQTVTPATAAVQIQSLTLNVSPGGNIAFVTPGVGLVTTVDLVPTIILVQVGSPGLLTINGLAPEIVTELVIEPGCGLASLSGLSPRLETSFQWIDVDAPPATTWTTTTGIAA